MGTGVYLPLTYYLTGNEAEARGPAVRAPVARPVLPRPAEVTEPFYTPLERPPNSAGPTASLFYSPSTSRPSVPEITLKQIRETVPEGTWQESRLIKYLPEETQLIIPESVHQSAWENFCQLYKDYPQRKDELWKEDPSKKWGALLLEMDDYLMERMESLAIAVTMDQRNSEKPDDLPLSPEIEELIYPEGTRVPILSGVEHPMIAYRQDYRNDPGIFIPDFDGSVEDALMFYTPVGQSFPDLKEQVELVRSGVRIDWMIGESTFYRDVSGSHGLRGNQMDKRSAFDLSAERTEDPFPRRAWEREGREGVSYRDVNDPDKTFTQAQEELGYQIQMEQSRQEIIRLKEEGINTTAEEAKLNESALAASKSKVTATGALRAVSAAGSQFTAYTLRTGPMWERFFLEQRYGDPIPPDKSRFHFVQDQGNKGDEEDEGDEETGVWSFLSRLLWGQEDEGTGEVEENGEEQEPRKWRVLPLELSEAEQREEAIVDQFLENHFKEINKARENLGIGAEWQVLGTRDYKIAWEPEREIDRAIAFSGTLRSLESPHARARLQGAFMQYGISQYLRSFEGWFLNTMPEELRDSLIAIIDSNRLRHSLLPFERRIAILRKPDESLLSKPEHAAALRGVPDFIAEKLVYVPGPVDFLMGSNDPESDEDERPIHPVSLWKKTGGIYVLEVDVTQELYRLVMEIYPVQRYGNLYDRRPIARLDSERWQDYNQLEHDDAVEFSRRVTEMIQKNGGTAKARLPWEAEYEFLAQGGLKIKYPTGPELTGHDANYYDNYPSMRHDYVHAVREYLPNGYGLYDMGGNVEERMGDRYGPYPTEWVEDPVGPDEGRYRVTRGGRAGTISKHMRVARRYHDHSASGFDATGFRIVVEPPKSK